MDEQRVDPYELLRSIQAQETSRGRLKIFFGYCAGVGKTYAMLVEAQEQKAAGVDVVLGYLEPHTRPDTIKQAEGFETIPVMQIEYKNMILKEFDLDAALKRKPQLLLIDELPHSNAPTCRNLKRMQDVEECLNAGIDVYTSMNVQHLESLHDLIKDITHVEVRERVSDAFFDKADQVVLCDLEPDELMKRLKEGKIYQNERIHRALNNFFIRSNLDPLREISLRRSADRISFETIKEVHPTSKEKLMVLISTSPYAMKNVRVAQRLAAQLHQPWVAVYVSKPTKTLDEESAKNLRKTIHQVEQIGGEVAILSGDSLVFTVVEYVHYNQIKTVLLGKSRHRKTLMNFYHQDIEDELIKALTNVQVQLIPDYEDTQAHHTHKTMNFSENFSFKLKDFLMNAIVVLIAIILGYELSLIESLTQLGGIVFILAILIIARIGEGYLYGILAAIVEAYFFHSFFLSDIAFWVAYPITLILMILVATMVSEITLKRKQQMTMLIENERKMQILHEINKTLLQTRGLKNILNCCATMMSEIFDRSLLMVSVNGESTTKLLNSDNIFEDINEKAVADWVKVNCKEAGNGSDTLASAHGYYRPIIANQDLLGMVGFDCQTTPFSHDEKLYLRMILSIIALALERQALSDQQNTTQKEKDAEQFRIELFGAIGENIRTPLTKIVKDLHQLSCSEKNEVLEDLKKESQQLVLLVENLLLMARSDQSNLMILKQEENLADFLQDVFDQVKKHYQHFEWNYEAKAITNLLEMDVILLKQVFLNVIECSVSLDEEAKISLSVFEANNKVHFEIENLGSQLQSYDLQKRRENFEKVTVGYNLSAKIMKAHHGELKIKIKNRQSLVFIISLPVPKIAS